MTGGVGTLGNIVTVPETGAGWLAPAGLPVAVAGILTKRGFVSRRRTAQ